MNVAVMNVGEEYWEIRPTEPRSIHPATIQRQPSSDKDLGQTKREPI